MALKDYAKYVPLNWSLMAHPANWILIALIVVMAGVGLAAIVIPYNAPTED